MSMKHVRNTYIELIRAHEEAHVNHTNHAELYQRTLKIEDKFLMLHSGSSASHTGGKLEGFVLALAALSAR